MAVWPAQVEADHYWLEWYRQQDDKLLGQARLETGHWQQALPVGEYRLLVRAVDGLGLRGKESWQDFTITPAPPPPEPEEASNWDLWVFIGSAALLLAL